MLSERRQRDDELGPDPVRSELAVVGLQHLHVRHDEAHQGGRHPLQLRHEGLIVTIEDIITSLALEILVTSLVSSEL